MKATTILRKIAQDPKLANRFGILKVNENNSSDFDISIILLIFA
jgi:hypothetical protein